MMMKKYSRTFSFTIILLAIFISDVNAQQFLPPHIISIKDGAEMVLIPEGEFISGVDQNEVKKIVRRLKEKMEPFYESEFPKTNKNRRNYYIDRHEVTNEQYERFLKETRHPEPKYWKWPQYNAKRQPVVGVGWADANAYCKWAGKRLPTEDEWEKAARGTDGRIWPWGNVPDDEKYNGKKQGNYIPVNVGSFPKGNSLYGVSDMAGNVWEMTSGIWENVGKAIRGGSFLNTNADVRVTVRWASSREEGGADYMGFRCVMDVENLKEFSREK